MVLGDIVLAEVLQGFRRDADFRRVRSLMRSFEVLPVLGEEMAVQSARNYRALRKRGITVRKTIDCVIATFCIERDLWLLHSDRDFAPFAAHMGLREVVKQD